MTSRLSRPRLSPGIPAGGLTAIAVLAATGLWALLAEEPATPRPSLEQRVEAFVHAHAEPTIRVMTRPEPASISQAVAEQVRAAEKAATAKADAMGQRRDPDIDYLQRSTDDDGTTRITGRADAPGALRLADFKGDVRIKVVDGATETLFILTNSRKRFNLNVDDGVLWITGPGQGQKTDPPVTLEVSLPRGTPLLVNQFAGDLRVEGDLAAPVRVELMTGNLVLGDVTSARVRVRGDGSVRLGRVTGLLAVQVPGNGRVQAEDVGQLAVESKGSGDVRIGQVAQGAAIDLSGSGGVRLAGLQGPFQGSVTGSGLVEVREGAASPFNAVVTGSGALRFRGTATDPRILFTGSGALELARHQGVPQVNHVGRGRLDLGS